jgi:hypothetical protein
MTLNPRTKCAQVLADPKKEGGAPLDDIYMARCEYLTPGFKWADMLADFSEEV